MAVPDFQSFFKPLLDIAADGKEHSMKEAREIIAKGMNIADADLREMMPTTALPGQGAILFSLKVGR
jgi:restriction system protein